MVERPRNPGERQQRPVSCHAANAGTGRECSVGPVKLLQMQPPLEATQLYPSSAIHDQLYQDRRSGEVGTVNLRFEIISRKMRCRVGRLVRRVVLYSTVRCVRIQFKLSKYSRLSTGSFEITGAESHARHLTKFLSDKRGCTSDRPSQSRLRVLYPGALEHVLALVDQGPHVDGTIIKIRSPWEFSG